jgi:hypothetical protein
MRLGKVVKSNSHCDYLVQLDDTMDYMNAPRPEDFGFGSFVKLESQDDNAGRLSHWGIGIIYNSQLLNPAFNNLGPRLTTEPDPLFAPDLVIETRTVLSVILVGHLGNDNGRRYGVQGIPRLVVPFNAEASILPDAEMMAFHQDIKGRSQFTYYSHLLSAGGSFAAQLVRQVIDELIAHEFFQGQDQQALSVLSRELSWKATMGAIR